MDWWRKMADEIARTLEHNGPLWSLKEEWCSQAFQQAHAIRAMLAAHRIQGRRLYRDMARDWADMTLRLQGTQGHPARYNMGYGHQIRKGIPRSWYVADCGTVAVTLLDVADLLGERDPFRQKIMDSVRAFADYIIETWTLPDGSFTLGYNEFELLNEKAYHCANAQSNLFLWPLAAMSGEEAYARQAARTSRWLAQWTEYECGYFGGTIHNRAYNGESMLVSLAFLPKAEASLREDLREHLRVHVAGWAVENYGERWFRDGQPSNAKDPLLLMTAGRFQATEGGVPEVAALSRKAFAAYDALYKEAFARVRKHGISGWAIAVRTEPRDLFHEATLPKYRVTDGLTGMLFATRKDPDSLFPLCLR